MLERRIDPMRHERIARRSAEIAARLRRICANFPDADFHALVQRAAEIDIRYTMRGGLGAFRDAIGNNFGPNNEPKPAH